MISPVLEARSLGYFLGNGVSRKIAFEIYCPLSGNLWNFHPTCLVHIIFILSTCMYGAGAQIPRGVSSTEREIEGHKEPSTTKCSYLPGRTL